MQSYFACKVYLYLYFFSTDTIIITMVLSGGEWLLIRIIESQLANFLNCEEVRDKIEKEKIFWPREKLLPRYAIRFITIITHLIVIFVSRCFRVRKKTLSMSCDGCDLLNCIIGLSLTTKNNSLCNHIMWWQIVFENWNRSVIDEGSTINDTGHLI